MIWLVFNPAARGEQADRLRRRLGLLGADCTLRPTTGAGSARALAMEAVRAKAEIVVAAGGDGTVGEVVDGLASEPGGLERTRLGILPIGTVNVFARALDVPLVFDRAWETIRGGTERRLDLPFAEIAGPGGVRHRRHFAQLAGGGMDARAIELTSLRLKKRTGAIAYLVAAMRAWIEPGPRVVAEADGRVADGSVVIVGNGRFYGGSLPFFPSAQPDDGLLDVAIFPRVTPLTGLRAAWSAATGSDAVSRGAIAWQTGSLRLRSEGRAPLQLDGELVGELPATIGIRPGVLRVLVPAP